VIKIHKAVTFKSVSETGLVEAVIATLGVMDKDGDVTMPGFFGTQEVVMIPTHDWNHIPIGKGVLSEEGNQAIARIQMNMDIPEAKAWHSALAFDLKNGKPLQQWSYGFNILDGGSEAGQMDGKDVRFLKPIGAGPGCKCWEVSPVLVGAGEGTGTRMVKSAGTDTPDTTFSDEAESVLAAAKALAVRGKSLADLRAKDGRSVSAANRERLAAVACSLKGAVTELAALSAPDVDPHKEYLRYLRMQSAG